MLVHDRKDAMLSIFLNHGYFMTASGGCCLHGDANPMRVNLSKVPILFAGPQNTKPPRGIVQMKGWTRESRARAGIRKVTRSRKIEITVSSLCLSHPRSFMLPFLLPSYHFQRSMVRMITTVLGVKPLGLMIDRPGAYVTLTFSAGDMTT